MNTDSSHQEPPREAREWWILPRGETLEWDCAFHEPHPLGHRVRVVEVLPPSAAAQEQIPGKREESVAAGGGSSETSAIQWLKKMEHHAFRGGDACGVDAAKWLRATALGYSAEGTADASGATQSPTRVAAPSQQAVEWTYARYRAKLMRNGEFFALVTPDGRNCLDGNHEVDLLNALNGISSQRQPLADSPASGEGHAKDERALAKAFFADMHPGQPPQGESAPNDSLSSTTGRIEPGKRELGVTDERESKPTSALQPHPGQCQCNDCEQQRKFEEKA